MYYDLLKSLSLWAYGENLENDWWLSMLLFETLTVPNIVLILSVQKISYKERIIPSGPVPWTAACQASLPITICQSLLKLMSIVSSVTSNHLILCHPLLLPSIFPSIRVFLMSWFFASGGQSIRASALASVLPINIQGWFPLGLTGLISLLLKGLSRVFFSATFLKHQFFCAQPSLWSYISIIQTIWLEK